MNLSVTYNGRLSREGFWTELLKCILWAVISMLPFGFLFFIFKPNIEQINFLFWMIALIFIWPLSSAYVRRLHDIGQSGWLFVVVFLPLIWFRLVDVLVVLTLIFGLIKGSAKGSAYVECPPAMKVTKNSADRPNILFYATAAMGVASIIMIFLALGASMNPTADTIALSRVAIGS